AAVSPAAPVAMQGQPLRGPIPDVDLTGSASPLLASAIGSVTLDGFTTGKADVSEANQKKLARTAQTIVKLLRKYPASKIHVLGYTDSVGQETDNQTLGQSRADAVQAALRDAGIPDIAIEAESRGAADPVVKTTKGEARNRRVEGRFDASARGSGLRSKGLPLGASGQPGQRDPGRAGGMGSGATDARKFCEKPPEICSPPSRKDVFQPIPDNTPYHLMDLVGVGGP